MQMVSTVEPAHIIRIQRIESRTQGIPFGQQALVAKQYLSGLLYRLETSQHLRLCQKSGGIESQPLVTAPAVTVALFAYIALNQKPG